MAYQLLTGATGLLGRYLLRDSLTAGLPVAVVVRRSRLASAQRRVDAVVRHWDEVLGRALPRPVVLEGDICDENLGLDEQRLRWVAENCDSVLHNAASLTFVAEGDDGEPWRSNVQGTRNVLEVCRRAGLRRFFHVSTAYVCGLRKDRVLESELDVGQQPGNDYERSKIQAETMVREAPYLEPPTVLRPSIIVGDSQTGYTTTFHGFYTPLQLSFGMSKYKQIRLDADSDFLSLMNLTDRDRKNFVPVDWVSAVTIQVVRDPRLHGQTYHLTNPRPVRVADICHAIGAAVADAVPNVPRSTAEHHEPTKEEQAFKEQMGIYQSYWRDDPEFDCTNTRSAAPHLPCPEVDVPMLRRLAKFAIDANFGWPRTEITEPEFDAHHHLEPLVRTVEPPSLSPAVNSDAAHANGSANGKGAHGANGLNGHALSSAPDARHCVGLQINGSGGGQWRLFVEGATPRCAVPGINSQCRGGFYMNIRTFAALASGQINIEQAVNSGRLVIESGGLPEPTLLQILEAIVKLPSTPVASTVAVSVAEP